VAADMPQGPALGKRTCRRKQPSTSIVGDQFNTLLARTMWLN
jgi:hypothetical protein